MANTRQAKKRILVNATKRMRNMALLSAVKTYMKRAKSAIETKATNAPVSVQDAIKAVDKAVSKGIIHKNTAARKKSRLMLHLNKVTAGKAE